MLREKQFKYILTKDDEKRKLEEILRRHFHFSRKVIQKLKIGEHVWLDDKPSYLNIRGKAEQCLTVDFSENKLVSVSPENMPIDILFEDQFFLAVNKPPGQVVHPTSNYRSGTLANAVIGYWENKGLSIPFRPVSRIDKNTSGIVMIAKNRYAHQQLAWLSDHNLVEKKYLGIVSGHFESLSGEISLPIRLAQNTKIVRETHPDGKTALTLYKVLAQYTQYSFLEFTLKTGRTHQIRVHCQATGHSLLGDDLYGGSTEFIARQALHSSSYSFVHPISGQPIMIQAPLPADMALIINQAQRLQ